MIGAKLITLDRGAESFCQLAIFPSSKKSTKIKEFKLVGGWDIIQLD
jgi:hypothetical protein